MGVYLLNPSFVYLVFNYLYIYAQICEFRSLLSIFNDFSSNLRQPLTNLLRIKKKKKFSVAKNEQYIYIYMKEKTDQLVGHFKMKSVPEYGVSQGKRVVNDILT